MPGGSATTEVAMTGCVVVALDLVKNKRRWRSAGAETIEGLPTCTLTHEKHTDRGDERELLGSK